MKLLSGFVLAAIMVVRGALAFTALPANAPQPNYDTTITTNIGGHFTTITATIDPPTWPWPPVSQPTSTPAVVTPHQDWVTTLTTSSAGHATTLTITYDSPIPTYITTTIDGHATTLTSTISLLPPFSWGLSTIVTTIDGQVTTVVEAIDPPVTTPAGESPGTAVSSPSGSQSDAGTTTCITWISPAQPTSFTDADPYPTDN
ncbi:hypothetical protein K466DRAFT_569541 [Polyporus arcularius HHB13444]|uniref:Uncharacterized protein n=1 Tax=Polyporus arcularius HHB13444 TaxID=1314778 RepID=A0A5C3NTE9_9APHY|nr:hypothetical protein K466DRAFT_569541 [Polyporus arcularius HHB13444]